MTSSEDVHSLLTALSSSFVNLPNQRFTTRARRNKLEKKYRNVLRSKAFDCLLFDFDEEFRVDTASERLQEASSLIAPNHHENVSERFQKLLDEYIKCLGREEALRVLAFLTPLANRVSIKPFSLLGYGELPAKQTLSKDLLDELEIFKDTPLLAPPDTQKYTYYPPSLFSDCAMTVADSAFSEFNSTADTVADPFHQSSYPIVDVNTYMQGPSATDESHHYEVTQSERMLRSHSTLYGALTNPILSDDQPISLELPPLGLPPISLDYPRESDRNRVSAAFTDTDRPDSGFGEEVRDDTRIVGKRCIQPLSWELKRRVGGVKGNDRQEKPYLTEAGREAFDLLYRLQLNCQLQITSATQSKEDIELQRHLYVISMRDLMLDVSRLLVGVSSKCFTFDQNTDSFSISQGLVVSGMSCQALAGVCELLVNAGTSYYRLNKLSEQTVAGLTIAAFLRSVSNYLSTYTAVALAVSPKARSPLHLTRLLKKLLNQIKFLATLCYCDGPAAADYPLEDFPQGIDLLSYVYKQADTYSSHYSYHLMLSLLRDTCKPYLRFLQDWVFYGRCSDPFEEFMITVDPYKLENKDRRCWTEGYLLDSARKKKCLFLGNISEKIYLGGKSLALLRRIVPDHDILTAGLEPPTLDVCLSKEQQLRLSSLSTEYNEKVKAMVKHKVYTRKMMLEERERKRVELIQQAQASQAERLAVIHKKIEERQRREFRKKQQQFAELKENMESEMERKKKENIEEKERDAELVEKLARREQMQTEADAKLEQQAREELTEYYRLLSETAAARERKALWRVRRRQLDSIREQWHSEQQNLLFDQLQQLEAGEVTATDTSYDKVRPVRSRWEKPDQLVISEQTPDLVDGADDIDSEHSTAKETGSQVDLLDLSNSPLPDQSQSTDTPRISDRDETPGVEERVGSTPLSAVIEREATSQLDDSVFTPVSAADVSRDIEAALSVPQSILFALAKRSTKSVAGQHVSSTTFDKEYLVRRPIRRTDPNRLSAQKEERRGRQTVGFHSSDQSSADTDSQMAQRMKLMAQKSRMSASKQSDEPDADVVRLEKFRVINKKGHASHSSIQSIMYYGSAQDDVSLDETLMPPVEAIKLEDVEEDYSQYDHNYQPEIMSEPSWSRRTHASDVNNSPGLALYEHVSLATLLQQSVTATLTSQISLSNKALLSYFMVELEFDKHMEVLHNYVLLAKGEFSLSFTLPLFEKHQSGDGYQRITSTYFLTDTLNRALQHVPLKDNAFLDNLMIAKGEVPRHMDTYSLHAFSWLSLTYKVAWPMNILITASHISMYERIFSFMVSLKHISFLLADSWHSLKLSTQTHSIDSESQQFRQLHLIRHDMQHFVKVIHGYLALQVTQVSWHQFQTELKSVDNLDGLFESHNRFIGRCLSRCFLSHKVQQIKQVVDGILKSIYKFHALLRLGHWQLNEHEEFIHTEYEAIAKAYLPFKEFTQFLNKVLTKMTESDKNEHLRELQIMLNFNGYYNKSNTRA